MKLLDKRKSDSDRQFVCRCYELLLGRQADPEGLASYLERLERGEIDHGGVLSEMASSEEYRRVRGGYDYREDPGLSEYAGRLDAELGGKLEANAHLDEAEYAACWNSVFSGERSLVIGQAEYGAQHRHRFFELCNGIGLLTQGMDRPQVLEIGVSEFSGMYRRLYPQLVLDCADRPVAEDYVGFTPQRIEQLASPRRQFSVDLNRPGEAQFAGAQGCYDLVLFAEVLEHLVVHPVDVLKNLVSLLRPGGYLYLTTPNFFRRQNRRKMAAWDNPQEVYPRGDGNWDLHHHHREYGHREMFQFVEEAGGVTRAFYFSACWDDPEDLPGNPAERGNMVFVIQAV